MYKQTTSIRQTYRQIDNLQDIFGMVTYSQKNTDFLIL